MDGSLIVFIATSLQIRPKGLYGKLKYKPGFSVSQAAQNAVLHRVRDITVDDRI
jgi:hypothetical protein